MRIWFSGPRILGGLLRPGVSFGREDGLRMLGGRRPARLPSWRRYELRHCLQEAAKARREEMTKEDADYRIDKALSTGRIDKNGALVFSAKDFPANSSREQLIDHLTEEIAALGLALPRRIAEAKVDAALAAKADRRSGRIARVAPLGIPAAISLVSGRCGKPRACGRYGPIAHGASLDRFGPRVALGEAPAHEASLSFFGA